jgi:hypothetical protein
MYKNLEDDIFKLLSFILAIKLNNNSNKIILGHLILSYH